MLNINNTTSRFAKLFVSVLEERRMMSIKFIVALGMLCLVGVYILKEMSEAGSSFTSFAGQFSWIVDNEGFGLVVRLIADLVANALAGPWKRQSCMSSRYCRVSENGLCCCSVFSFPQCVATSEECTTRIGGVDYHGYCIDPE